MAPDQYPADQWQRRCHPQKDEDQKRGDIYLGTTGVPLNSHTQPPNRGGRDGDQRRVEEYGSQSPGDIPRRVGGKDECDSRSQGRDENQRPGRPQRVNVKPIEAKTLRRIVR
jgi:hypothetical protein